MADCKVYVDVELVISKEGQMIPKSFTWEDDRRYEIDKITRVEMCASRKAGGNGLRYTCFVGGRECHLFYEVDKFFMERKTS